MLQRSNYDCPMTEKQRQTAMDLFKENGIFQTLGCMDGCYTDEGFKDRKFNKGKAVRQVCERLNIPLCRSIAIGGSISDIEMLKTAGLSICMRNGSEELKRVADDICPSVQEDGILHTFSKYLLAGNG